VRIQPRSDERPVFADEARSLTGERPRGVRREFLANSSHGEFLEDSYTYEEGFGGGVAELLNRIAPLGLEERRGPRHCLPPDMTRSTAPPTATGEGFRDLCRGHSRELGAPAAGCGNSSIHGITPETGAASNNV